MVKYQVEVYTGSVENASTAANVFINIYANDGNTGRRALKKSQNNRVKFSVGQVSLVTFLRDSLMALSLLIIIYMTYRICMTGYLDMVLERCNRHGASFPLPDTLS